MSEEINKKPASSSNERQVVGYLRPSLAVKFEKYVQNKGCSKSEAINDAVQKLLEPMGPQQIFPK
jgi:metal-responsive CopG/Arc/MetJ family transcriptional regulator